MVLDALPAKQDSGPTIVHSTRTTQPRSLAPESLQCETRARVLRGLPVERKEGGS